jgi:hypothetical protein
MVNMNMLLAVALLWATPATEGRIDYSHPKAYLRLPPSIGDAHAVRAVAQTLAAPGQTDEEKLRVVGKWIQATFRLDPAKSWGPWRGFSQALADKTVGGCADTAVMFGALARALGVPTVWVKTLDVSAIRTIAGDPNSSPSKWSGHVFVESFVDGHWHLVDPVELIIYDSYDPHAHLLPGDRWAYDKGDDPGSLTLSLDKDNWIAQTRSYFRHFDLRQLPPVGRALVRKVFVVADSPHWQQLQARAASIGMTSGVAFNRNFERLLPQTSGHWLVLTAVGDHFPLPPQLRDQYSPVSTAKLQEMLRLLPSGRVDRALADGTRVVLLFARSSPELAAEIEHLTLDEKSPMSSSVSPP